MDTSIKVHPKRKQTGPAVRKFKWKEANSRAFAKTMEEEIKEIKLDLMDTEFAIKAYMQAVHTATLEGVPYTMSRNKSRPNKLKWTQEMESAVKLSKKRHYEWKTAGRPKGEDLTWIAKKNTTHPRASRKM